MKIYLLNPKVSQSAVTVPTVKWHLFRFDESELSESDFAMS